MELTTLSLILSGLAILLAIYAIIRKQPAAAINREPEKFASIPLQLQAYERLVLLTERIALPNLISRLNKPGISAYEMKVILVETIRQEFDYNRDRKSTR